MVRERPVHVGVERRHFAADALQQARRHQSSHAVAAVRHHLQWALGGDVGGHFLYVAVDQRGVAHASAGLARFFPPDAPAQPLDAFPGQGRAADHHLQAVVFRRIVRAGNHDAGARFQGMGGVVDQRRRHAADVDGPHSTSAQTAQQRRAQRACARAAVAAHHHLPLPGVQRFGGEGAADLFDRRFRERAADHAANVVGAEDLRARRRVVAAHHAWRAYSAATSSTRRCAMASLDIFASAISPPS